MSLIKNIFDFSRLMFEIIIVFLLSALIAIGSREYLLYGHYQIIEFIVYFLLCALSLMIVAFVVVFIHHQEFNEIGFKCTDNAYELIAIGFIISFSCLTLCVLISNLLGFFDYVGWGIEKHKLEEILLTVIFQCFLRSALTAFYEETFWRGYVMSSIQKKYNNPIASIALSAFLFALVHVRDSISIGIVTIFIGGLLLGYMLYCTKSIYIGMGMHFGWNLVYSLLAFTPESPKYPSLLYSQHFKMSTIGLYVDVAALCTLLLIGALFEWWYERRGFIKT